MRVVIREERGVVAGAVGEVEGILIVMKSSASRLLREVAVVEHRKRRPAKFLFLRAEGPQRKGSSRNPEGLFNLAVFNQLNDSSTSGYSLIGRGWIHDGAGVRRAAWGLSHGAADLWHLS